MINVYPKNTIVETTCMRMNFLNIHVVAANLLVTFKSDKKGFLNDRNACRDGTFKIEMTLQYFHTIHLVPFCQLASYALCLLCA